MSSLSEMSSSPPSPKRIRLDGGMKLDELEDDMLIEILRFLPMKDWIHSRLVSKRWQLAMPKAYPVAKCLEITDLPFKSHLIRVEDNGNNVVTSGGITAALECLLPQIGSRLKILSFLSDSRYWEMVASHFDLIAQCSPAVNILILKRMTYAEPNECNWEALRRLTHLHAVGLENFTDPTETHDNFQVTQRMSSLIGMWPLKKLTLTNFDYLPHIVAPNLTLLSVKNCNLDDFQWAQICQTSPKLLELFVESCDGLEDFTSIGQLRNLIDLTLVRVTLGDGDMETIAQGCPDLIRLDLEVENLGSLTWLRHLDKLSFVSISPGLIDSDMNDIPANWPIYEFEMYDSQLTDPGLDQLSRKSPLLDKLTLQSESITDVGINQIAASWNRLESVKLGSPKITGDGLVTLGQRKNLRLLDIVDCSGISNVDGFRLLVEKRRQLGISTPLRITLGRDHAVFATEMVELRKQLENVGVTLIQ